MALKKKPVTGMRDILPAEMQDVYKRQLVDCAGTCLHAAGYSDHILTS